MRFSLRRASRTGLLLGAALAVSGGLAAFYAPAQTVHHGPVFRVAADSALRKPEQVPASRARFYGGSVMVAGVLLSLFSLYVPGRPTREP